VSTNDTAAKDIIYKLEEHSQISNFIHILKALDTHPFKWTRKCLSEELVKYGINLSESQVKRYLSTLKEFDIVQCKTGDGTYIKDMGRLLLKKYE
jgi:repressor of nif and glnA expression